MTVNVRVTRILTRTAAAGMAAGLLMAAAPASAAPVSAAAVSGPAAAGAPARAHVYQTLVTGLAVREAASTTSLKRAVLGAAGTKVRVRCFVIGQSIGGDNVWYMITAPRPGLVVGFYLDTGSDPALGIPSCIRSVRHVRHVRHVYQTLVTGLAVRQAPSSTSAKRAALGTAGTEVTVRCFAFGQSVAGDNVWYRITAPRTGMVSGFYLSTGRDPATGIRHC